MKLVLLTAIHGRHELAELMLRHATQIAGRVDGVELEIVAAISPEDKGIVPALRVLDAEFCVVKNEPVSAKWQAALSLAWDVHGHDAAAVWIMGSDDFATEGYLRHSYELLESRDSLGWGPESFFVYDAASGRLGRFGRLAHGSTGLPIPVGAGRVLTGELLDRLSWRLWTRPADHGLDTMASQRIHRMGYSLDTMRVDQIPGAAIVDVKLGDGQNITPVENLDFTDTFDGCQATGILREMGLEFLRKVR